MRTALIVLAGLVLTGLGVYFGYTNGVARNEALQQAAEQQAIEQIAEEQQAEVAHVSNETAEAAEEVVEEPAAEEAVEEASAEEPAEEVAEEPAAEIADGIFPAGYEVVAPITGEPQSQFTHAEQVLEDGYDYAAALETAHGTIVVELYAEHTPLTVNNFVFLALQRYYDGVPFHRVLEDFMAQTGDPTGTGRGGPGYQFADEIVDDLTFNAAGILAMANSGPGTNGSQFFITFAPTEWLNGNHTIFGHVVSGENVLDNIRRIDPSAPAGVVRPTDTFADLLMQGIDLGIDSKTPVGEGLAELLGAAPVAGQSFPVGGYIGTVGTLNTGEEAYGFYPIADILERVIIGRKAH